MGFWLYFVLPLVLSLVALSITRMPKLHKSYKAKKLLGIVSLIFLVIALAFAVFVVIYSISKNVPGMNTLYITMLAVLIGYAGFAAVIKPND